MVKGGSGPFFPWTLGLVHKPLFGLDIVLQAFFLSEKREVVHIKKELYNEAKPQYTS